jgi:hypothetical protein
MEGLGNVGRGPDDLVSRQEVYAEARYHGRNPNHEALRYPFCVFIAVEANGPVEDAEGGVV